MEQGGKNKKVNVDVKLFFSCPSQEGEVEGNRVMQIEVAANKNPDNERFQTGISLHLGFLTDKFLLDIRTLRKVLQFQPRYI